MCYWLLRLSTGITQKDLLPGLLLKLIFLKAFDSVRWDFILIALHAYNIPENIISAIKACITTPAFSLSINGVTAGYFKGRTWLRQGDPLSPVFFVLVMNVLSIMLDKAAKAGIFDYHHGCSHIQLTHLAFADHLLIFTDGSEKSLAGVFTILSQFEKLSGLAVNIQKTSMFSSGLSQQLLDRIKMKFLLSSELANQVPRSSSMF